jgi:hypothetical protein
MTTRRVELAPEHPDRQQRMTGERGVEPSDSKGRGFQWGDHITVAQPATSSLRSERSADAAWMRPDAPRIRGTA